MDLQISAPLSALIVDDDLPLQQMVGVLLHHHGFEVDLVDDGENALKRIHDRDYDVILLDLMLPRMNGFEVVRHLKAAAPDVLARVIVVTAASERTLESFQQDQVRKLMRKPFDIHELVGEALACGNARSRNGGKVVA